MFILSLLGTLMIEILKSGKKKRSHHTSVTISRWRIHQVNEKRSVCQGEFGFGWFLRINLAHTVASLLICSRTKWFKRLMTVSKEKRRKRWSSRKYGSSTDDFPEVVCPTLNRFRWRMTTRNRKKKRFTRVANPVNVVQEIKGGRERMFVSYGPYRFSWEPSWVPM